MSEFNFRISCRPGKEGEKPDILTRLAQDKPTGVDNFRHQRQFQTLLKAEHLDDNLRKAFAVIFCVNTTVNNEAEDVDDVVDKLVNEVDEDKNKNIVDVRDYTGLDLRQHTSEEQNLELNSSSTKMARSGIKNSLENLLDKAYQDNIVNSIIDAKRQGLRKLPADLTKQGIKLAMGDLTLRNNSRGESVRLYVKDRMYILNDKSLKLFLLQQHHEPPTQGHPGYKAMLWKLLENWY